MIKETLTAAQEAANQFTGTVTDAYLASLDERIKDMSSQILNLNETSLNDREGTVANLRKNFNDLDNLVSNYTNNFLYNVKKVDKYVNSCWFRFLKFTGLLPQSLENIEDDLGKTKEDVQDKRSLIMQRLGRIEELSFAVMPLILTETDGKYKKISEDVAKIVKAKNFDSEEDKTKFEKDCRENLKEWQDLREKYEGIRVKLNSNSENRFASGNYSFIFENGFGKIDRHIMKLEGNIQAIPGISVRKASGSSSSSKSSGDSCSFVCLIIFLEMLGNLIRAA